MPEQISSPTPSRLPLLPPRRKGKRRTVTMPTCGVGPHVKLAFAEMARQGVTYDELEWRSGIRRASVKAWRRRNCPSLSSIEAVLGSLGYSFMPMPALEKLPAHLARDVEALAARLRADIPYTWAALIDIGASQKLLKMRAAERAALIAEREAQVEGLRTRRLRKPTATVQ